VDYGACRFDLTLTPVSGKAVPLRRGEVIRITQVEGGQCVDFNAFGLHDYKEYMDVSMTRPLIGFRAKTGDLIFSNPPRMRPLLGILYMSPTCVTDLLGRMCNAVLFEAGYGFALHTNCQDTMAQAIAEYGLLPEDTHHSLNLWMDTEWDSTGRWFMTRNSGQPGDHVDLLAVYDLLVAVAICGAGDVSHSSNFWFKPIQIQVFEGSRETQVLAEKVREKSGMFRNQNRPGSGQIRSERKLSPAPGFEPEFIDYPMRTHTVEVHLTRNEFTVAEKLVRSGYGNDVEDVVRRAFVSWYLQHRSRYLGEGARSWTRIPASWL
jgi:uncharacterized protein